MPPTGSAFTPWLPRSPSARAVGRVFCIPQAGCSAGVFDRWPVARAGVEFLPVELPGRLARYGEQMPATFEDLAATMLSALAPYLDVPFAFFGHCWAALAAFEAAVQLDQTGPARPARLFVSSQLAPQDGPEGKMLDMSDAELREELAASIRARGQRPHPELVSVYGKILRADVEVSRRYVVPAPPPRLSCPITAIGWADDEEVSAGRMSGWSGCGDTTFVMFPGGHERFTDAPAALLAALSFSP